VSRQTRGPAGPAALPAAAARWLAGAYVNLADLVLPVGCAGCGAEPAGARPARAGPEADAVRLRYGVCPRCVAALAALRPAATRPDPAPSGLPPTVCLGPYEGPLREVLLAYKERGRHGLAGPLGRLLAESAAFAAGDVPGGPVVLVPVPSSARAARQRHGDHLARLSRHTLRRLREAGRPAALARPVRALPRPDSAGLGGAQRAAVAERAFAVRGRPVGWLRRAVPGVRVVLLDDIVTTGSTLAAVARALAGAGVPVAAAAVLAATPRRHPPSGWPTTFHPTPGGQPR
jgi:predicted amidophosphoribosyltransferase